MTAASSPEAVGDHEVDLGIAVAPFVRASSAMDERVRSHTSLQDQRDSWSPARSGTAEALPSPSCHTAFVTSMAWIDVRVTTASNRRTPRSLGHPAGTVGTGAARGRRGRLPLDPHRDQLAAHRRRGPRCRPVRALRGPGLVTRRADASLVALALTNRLVPASGAPTTSPTSSPSSSTSSSTSSGSSAIGVAYKLPL